MTTEDRIHEIERILDLRAGRSTLSSAENAISRRPDLRGMLEAADVAWASQQGAPPLDEDPVAAMLGLVPDAGMTLDAKALATARKSAGLSISALAGKLARRGWGVTTRDIFAWERGNNLPSTPALINALAVEVGLDASRLRRPAQMDPERVRLAALVHSPAFENLAKRWAKIQGTTVPLAASALESRVLIAVHRGGAPDTVVLLDSLEALIGAVESTGEL